MKTDPYWWEDAGAPAAADAADGLPAETDVVVIGAGLTGLSAARTLARAGKSVIVLEAHAPGHGASSRNGGMIGGGHKLSVDDMEQRFGKETAAGLLREAHIESTEFAKSLIRDEQIACDFVETGRFRALWRESEYDPAARALERLQGIIPLEAHMVPPARQHDEIASDLYAGGTIFARHGGLNPAKWVAGLMDAAARAGAMIVANTPVTAIEKSGAAFHVVSPRGTVKTGSVLAATNGYTTATMPKLKRRIIPVPSFIVTTEQLGAETVSRLFPTGRMIVESRDRHCYYRPSPDGTRIVFGGRAAMFDAPAGFATNQMRGLIGQAFPELKNVGLTHSWRGYTGFTFEFLPHVGKIDGIWHAMGYSGSGNAMAPWLGHKAALQIIGDEEGETAFSKTGFPTRWWHRGWPWFLPAVDVGFRLKDFRNSLGKTRA